MATTFESSIQKQRSLPAKDVLFRAVIRGLKGGFIATAVMTLFRLPIFRSLPPTAEFWALYVGGGEAEQYLFEGLFLHFLYGVFAGGLFGSFFSTLDARMTFDREPFALVSGLLYGLVLSVVGTRIIFRYVLGRELEDDERLVFHVGHIIYGLTLGSWFGSRERFGDVYE